MLTNEERYLVKSGFMSHGFTAMEVSALAQEILPENIVFMLFGSVVPIKKGSEITWLHNISSQLGNSLSMQMQNRTMVVYI